MRVDGFLKGNDIGSNVVMMDGDDEIQAYYDTAHTYALTAATLTGHDQSVGPARRSTLGYNADC